MFDERIELFFLPSYAPELTPMILYGRMSKLVSARRSWKQKHR